MARARKRGDSNWNAIRRYARQSERYLKQASTMQGVEKSRTEALARSSLERAISTYSDPSKAENNSLIRNLSQRLNPQKPTRSGGKGRQEQLKAESFAALESSRDDEEMRRELEAEEILSTDIGNRVYGALVDVWKDSPYIDRNEAIMEHFGADSMADVLQAIEDAGIDLYADPESLERYEEIRTAISERFA